MQPVCLEQIHPMLAFGQRELVLRNSVHQEQREQELRNSVQREQREQVRHNSPEHIQEESMDSVGKSARVEPSEVVFHSWVWQQ